LSATPRSPSRSQPLQEYVTVRLGDVENADGQSVEPFRAR
jgi:hypothetical protein